MIIGRKYLGCITILWLLVFTVCKGHATPNTDSLVATHAHDFVSPLHILLSVSGNFLEPRPGAYHMGVDFPAAMGTPVYAACAGYVWRLRITPYGYGRAVYIKHKNGLLTVYGHFSRFSDTLAHFLNQYQYAHKANEVDMYPDSTRFYVKQGELIGFVGNAGLSTAPHLHFEIREAEGETFPLNPLLFSGFDTHDSKAPLINSIALYEGSMLTPHVITAQQGATIICHTNKVWLGVSAIDLDDIGHRYGIYGYVLTVDGKEIFRREKKRLDFACLGNTEAHIDYTLRKQGVTMYRLYTLPHDEEYPSMRVEGISMQPNQTHSITIEVYDVYHNTKKLSFILKGAPVLNGYKEYDTQAMPYIWKGRNAIIEFPANCAYMLSHPVVTENDKSINVSDDYPVAQKKFRVKYIAPDIDTQQRHRTVMHFGSSVSTVKWSGDTAIAEGEGYGAIYLQQDNIPPVVHITNQGIGNMIAWTMSDDMSGTGAYNIYIDDNWHVCYYDAKTLTVLCDIQDISMGQHTAHIIVNDKVGNITSLNIPFTKGVIKKTNQNKTNGTTKRGR